MMTAAQIVSDGLLLFGVVLGPVIFSGCVGWQLLQAARVVIAAHKQRRFIRSLPCPQCLYFSECDSLPCAVNPCCVLTEEARCCKEFVQKEHQLPALDNVLMATLEP